MTPSVDLRISTMLRAMEDVVGPAIDLADSLALEQSALVIGHLRMLAIQWSKADGYAPRTIAEVTAALDRLLGDEGGTLSGVRRMAEGASKEQLVFEYDGPRGVERLVLRMDPLEGLIETCRRREDQILRAMDGTVPVPKVRYADTVGSYQVSLSSPMRPFSEADGHDVPGLIDETLPGEAAMIEDVVVGFEDSV